ncbi:NRAMP-like transporter smf [Seminavis robusta]|uniref:NRAMP-like transporter smf n=1 Tax=Seminavis robusta TaxID=568900 RepID=A0A9N8DG79_9STRA|nr:NRAMP-like transporter smf [Seminavis robusta]|eukprot:Sro126_g060660.1 NRAMP-like transporter smf (521) ;mRNA; f:95955-98391
MAESEHASLAGNQNGDVKKPEKDEEVWSPSGSAWRDFLYFCGPGWFVSIAYVDPGNYQADIQAGATTRYYLLFSVWWSTLLSIYIQCLCVRLAFYGKMNLAQAQAKHVGSSRMMRYLNWAIAEFSTIITDLPEVIGFGIACNIIFGWPYYVGVLLSLLTTMMFLATMNYGMKVLEGIVFLFVFIMAVALFVEMSFVGVNTGELFEGWFIGFKDVTGEDVFSITGILGAVVMPHNLYLHTAALQSRKVEQKDESIRMAVKWSSFETVIPIIFSFFMNMAVIAIAAERVYGQVTDGEQVGLTDFCEFFKTIKGGCALWAIALLAAGQSSAITTTYTGQYVMDGFLNIQLPVSARAIVTRLVAITPCVIVSAAFPDNLNQMVNVVNSSLAFLLPFAFTPLVKYTCSHELMGTGVAPKWEKYLLYTLCFVVWAINAIAFSAEGGGLFADRSSNYYLRSSTATSKDHGSMDRLSVKLDLAKSFLADQDFSWIPLEGESHPPQWPLDSKPDRKKKTTTTPWQNMVG